MHVISFKLLCVIVCWCSLVQFVLCEPPLDAALEEEANSSILIDDLGDTEHVADTDEFIGDSGKSPNGDGGTIERAYDASSNNQEVGNLGDKGGKSTLQDTLKAVDFTKLLKVAGNGSTEEKAEVVKNKNIQRVAKKISNLMGSVVEEGNEEAKAERLDSSTEIAMANVTHSDVLWLARIFSVVSWDPYRLPGQNRLSSMCAASMSLYLRELRNGTVWADKMADSTGRYSSQFFFGNDFWLGSRTECHELQNKDFNDKTPPFHANFYVSKFWLELKNKGPLYNRLLSIGLCLPQECSVNDVKIMLEEDSNVIRSTNPKRAIRVISVRAVPGQYSLFRDKKLHLVFIISSVVLVLTFIGTFYELSLKRKQNRWYKKHQASVISNNNEGDMKIITPLENQNSMEAKLENESAAVVPNRFNGGESVFSQFILSFSAVSNSKKILHVGSAPEDSLTCVHGLRFLSLAWVIMVHTYLQVFTIAENKSLRTLAERNFMFQTVSNATFSVDTFFFISGLLVTYLYFKSMRTDGSEKGRRAKTLTCGANVQKFFKLVGYRFLRLTPAYMFVLLIAEISMRWIHNYSVFEPMSQNHVSCDKYWWRNILYINSLYPMKDMCMLWSWYVSNDTQFYIVGIIILLVSVRYFRFSVAMLFFFLFTSWAVTISISLYYDYRAKIEDPFLLFDELYDKPWTRIGPYLIGMFAGWYIFKTKCQLHVSKCSALIYWFLSIFTLLSLVYGLHVYPLAAVGSALYVSIGHSAWAAALAWIVIACCAGYGGLINSFLSFKLLHPLSRLTYCAYLVHPIIMTTTNFQMNAPLHLQDSIVMILYFGNILASFLASFCISLLFEAPVVRVLKIIFSSQPRQSTKSQTNL